MLIWIAGAPVSRMRAASFDVCWSPSMTPIASLSFSALIVRTKRLVLPEPGLETKLRAKMPLRAK
ncbi:hypothetical protein D3C87_2168120 [compost metagenome]